MRYVPKDGRDTSSPVPWLTASPQAWPVSFASEVVWEHSVVEDNAEGPDGLSTVLERDLISPSASKDMRQLRSCSYP